MTDLKQTLQVETEGTIVAAQQTGFSFVNSFKMMPKWRRILTLALIIAIIPGYLLARIGTEYYQKTQYARQALVAHPAFTAASNPKIGEINLIKNPNGNWSAYAVVTNPNLDLAAEDINYTISFRSSTSSEAYRTTGTFYLLPDEKRYIVVPKIDTTEYLISGTLTLGDVKWQKKLTIPEINLKATEPITSEQQDPQAFFAEGSIINNSPYDLTAIRIVYLLFDQNNKVIGVSQRDESQIPAFGRRSYKQQWPGLTLASVNKVQVIASTDSIDPANVKINTNTNTSPDPRDNSNTQ